MVIQMAIYVTSDLHGLPLKELKRLLDSVSFSDADWLFILGDVIDRENDGGVEILEWLLTQHNVSLILGNHEAMLLSCRFIFEEITENNLDCLTPENWQLLTTYNQNGGDVTLKSLKGLLRSRPDTLWDILDYLSEAPLYETVGVNNRDFLLVHSGLGNFHPTKKLSDYTADELLWTRPEINEEYFGDVLTLFGHTPTVYYGTEHKGRILRHSTWIDVDVGVAFGNSPALLRLDDLKEFYLDK